MSETESVSPITRRRELRSLALLFLKLGTVAFGGPAAHVAMMEEEVVARRKWLSRERFLDLWGATHLIPGPNSTELAIHIGHARAGWPGLLVAGGAFILPAMLIVLAIAWAYRTWGTLPELEGVLAGVKPVVLVVVAQALLRLGRSALRGPLAGAVALAALAAAALGAHELLVLFAAGVAALAASLWPRRGVAPALVLPALAGTAAGPAMGVTGAAAAAAGAVPFSLPLLFWTFAKIGAVLFGSGYVLLAFLRADFVERFGWLTEAELLDAVAIGQVTPGPLFTTATFIGYLAGGLPGGLLATAGIFLPAFVFVAISGPLVPRLRASRRASAILDGVNAASLALMALVTFELARAAVSGGVALALAAATALLLFRFRVNSAWLVLGGALAGWLLLGGG
ncbi:MAG: chromate efflux transporter [Thermoanaerobaculia bacterium]|nr:chromate efflux transporter [Thermoanaerobaculia bacterium]